ncbi:hypothetical protein ACIBLB_12165 [Streptosporangium canum]|uniref:hypothetical protein n=1 Tax=Streptosporangium canum TaxID=324952 RepID=UPI0037903335
MELAHPAGTTGLAESGHVRIHPEKGDSVLVIDRGSFGQDADKIHSRRDSCPL